MNNHFRKNDLFGLNMDELYRFIAQIQQRKEVNARKENDPTRVLLGMLGMLDSLFVQDGPAIASSPAEEDIHKRTFRVNGVWVMARYTVKRDGNKTSGDLIDYQVNEEDRHKVDRAAVLQEIKSFVKWNYNKKETIVVWRQEL